MMRRRRRWGVAGVAMAADAGSEISNAPKTGRDYSAEEGERRRMVYRLPRQ